MSYTALIEDMVEANAQLLGDQAVAIAGDVRGIHVNGDGSVEEITVDGKTAADDLLQAYVNTVGPAVEGPMQSVATEYEDDLDLPPSLE